MKSKIRQRSILLIGLILLLTSLVVGCPQPSVSAPPVITEFIANPTEIISGGSATLFWIVTGDATVTIDQGIGGLPKSGTLSVSPTTTTAYTLTAINNAEIVTRAVVISVIPLVDRESEEEENSEQPPAQWPPVVSRSELRVHFIDVGQGDSILVDLGETEVLIDGGGKSSGVVEYLVDFVDGALEVMIATHPHADHIGGLITVLDVFEVDEVWLNGDTSTSQTYSQFVSAVNSEGAQVYEARRGDTIQVGDFVFNVLHPVSLNDTVNNNSIVLSLSYGEIDFLFTGDAEKEAEASMLAAGIVPDVEILKVGHHGSSSSSSAQFLDAVKPLLAIYMAGEGNSYGHPHQETITALTEVGTLIQGTDMYGTIIITSTGEEPFSVQPPYSAQPARFVLGDLTITPTAVSRGEMVTTSITVSNTGGIEGSYTVDFTLTKVGCWSSLKNVEVTLKPGETKTVTFISSVLPSMSYPPENVLGTYTVNVNGKVGQYTVTAPEPTPEELEAKQVIKDLAYIKASIWSYSDDADPEYEGVSITVSYYNSKSERIYFEAVSVTVSVELYWYTNYPPIYQEQVIMDSNASFYKLGEEMLSIPDLNEVVRIPFGGIEGKPSGMTRGPILILTVSTPNQGEFTIQETIAGFLWP